MSLAFTLIASLLFLAQASAAPAPSDLYQVVFIRLDPARKTLSKEEGERLQAAHMANIHKMADDGILMAAGPFEDEPTTISGIFVMKAASLEQAQKIAEQIPQFSPIATPLTRMCGAVPPDLELNTSGCTRNIRRRRITCRPIRFA